MRHAQVPMGVDEIIPDSGVGEPSPVTARREPVATWAAIAAHELRNEPPETLVSFRVLG